MANNYSFIVPLGLSAAALIAAYAATQYASHIRPTFPMKRFGYEMMQEPRQAQVAKGTLEGLVANSTIHYRA